MPSRAPAALRARRMLALLPHLAADAEIGLAALAAMLGATPEELTEDITALSCCGTAPYTPDALVSAFVEEDGVVRAYEDPPALERPVRLTPAEARALTAALEIAGATADDPLLAKLMTAAAADADPAAFARLVRTAAEPGGALAVYGSVADAIARRRRLRIDYWSADRGKRSERVIRPYELAFDRGFWYLSAHCETAGADRVFRLDRIVACEPEGTTFERPDEVPPALPAFDLAVLSVAEVVFDAGEEFAERDWPGAVAERRDDGSVLARVPYSSPGWVARRVAARLGRARVLGPEEVRAAVRAIAGGEDG